jgi:mRNA interferase HigB
MRVIALSTLKNYYSGNAGCKQSLLSWHDEARKAAWKNHNELKRHYVNASIIGDKRVVFNINGNRHRLIVDIEYRLQTIYIVWIGSHADYDDIDAKTISYVKTGKK